MCSSEAFGASNLQWRTLARDTFILYAGGHSAESRPRATYSKSVLTVPFVDRGQFLDFVMQARQMTPTRLIDFRVENRHAREVTCVATFNLTPALLVRGNEMDPSVSQPDPVIIHM